MINQLKNISLAKAFYVAILFLLGTALYSQENSEYTLQKNKAGSFLEKGNYDSAKAIYLELIPGLAQKRNLSELAVCNNNLSVIYNKTGDFVKAMEHALLSLKYFEELNDTVRMVAAYINIGNNYQRRFDDTTALKYYYKALRTNIKNKVWLGSLYCTIANSLVALKKYQEAFSYFKRSETTYLTSSENVAEHLATLYNNLAYTYIDLDSNITARIYVNKGLKIYKEISDSEGMSVALMTLASTYFNGNGNNPSKKSLQYCLSLIDSAGNIAAKNNLRLIEIESLKRKSQALVKLGRAEEAFTNLAKYLQQHDSILSVEKESEVYKINTQYEVAQKEKKNLELENENNKQSAQLGRNRLLLFGIILVFLFISVVGYLIFRQRNLRNRQLKIELEQKLLRSQMNPHFIFNSLQAIQKFILRHNEKEAISYLSSFGDLTRMILENSRLETIPLQKEIELLKNYLNLQKLPYGDKFTYSLSVAPDIDTESTHIPPMLAQPFIENAIEHGFNDLQAGGVIEVSFSKMNNNLLLEIKDNGAGINPEKAKQRLSLATTITRERIELINKKSKAEASFIIDEAYPSENNKGVRVVFTLPLQT